MLEAQDGVMGATDLDRTSPTTTLPQRVSWWFGRQLWDRRAHTWHHEGSVGLESVISAVLDQAAAEPGCVAVDLGCGSGQLSVPLARLGAHVTAVDISPKMIDMVRARAAEEHLDQLTAQVAPVERLSIPAQSVDLVVTNYALHHLHDGDKQAVVRAAAGWLRPGGRLVVGDMMFGRGATKRDREIIRSKVTTLLQRGPSGWYRVAKNVLRFSLRLRERPVSADTWCSYFRAAGFDDVTFHPVVSEAGIVVGRKP